MTSEEVQINDNLRKGIASVMNITTDEEALNALLVIAHEHANGIFDWFSRQKEVYNFVGDPDSGYEPLCASRWENNVFGSTFVVLCRQVKKIDGRHIEMEVCERKFKFDNPQPDRVYF